MNHSNPKSDKELVLFVLEQIKVIEEYLKDVNEYGFYQNRMLKDACYARIMVIGEYARRISNEVQNKHPNIEWAVMKSARNFYAHAYGALDWKRIWQTLHEEIPKLEKDFEKILSEL